MNPTIEDILLHSGVLRRSGRYPWGSGENPHQHSGDFISRVEELKKSGKSDTEIAKDMNLSTTQFRVQRSIANGERRALEYETAKGLRAEGLSFDQIAQKMGYTSDSSIRSLLNENTADRMQRSRATADFLKKVVDEKGMVEVGKGVNLTMEVAAGLNISPEKMKEALYLLELEGYPTYGGRVDQVTNPGKKTTITVLCPPGTPHSEIFKLEKIHQLVDDYVSHDDGDTFDKFVYPKSMDSNRLKIRYAEEGGIHKDGVMEIRRGVDDLSLGKSHYAQVRILVDDNRYLKGMAVYSDDLPKGVDIVFNTNKKAGTPKEKVLKEISKDPDNPFGSLIKAGGQSYYNDDAGNKQLSLINKRAEEGDWGDWSNNLPSQFLSKQPRQLIKKQLDLAKADKISEFEEINSLTNPTLKKALLSSFAEDCDSAAVHLHAAALPRQRYKVILPVTTLKDTEVYAPDYENGEKVALIRYPHGGTFEIPILTVNNKHPDAKRILENAADAVGINSKIAERLSGADFDGDTVMVIPTGGKINILSTKPLDGLVSFDSKALYQADRVEKDADGNVRCFRGDREFRPMKNTQTEMGKISNLITDMTLIGATDREYEKAVKHSMVVIDAEKHHLDYKKSEVDNDIALLKKKYQGRIDEDGKYHTGASTLISRSKSETPVLKRKGSPRINQVGKEWYDPNQPEGALLWKSVEEVYVDAKTGKTKIRTQKSTKMAETQDARSLSSGTVQEEIYAEYANTMKALANDARKTMISTGDIKYSPSAKDTYRKEVNDLEAKLNESLKNAPRERYAQTMANAEINAKKQYNPDMTRSEIKKASQQALAKARAAVGAKRKNVDITDKEWEAIQAGAISPNKLSQIIKNTDPDVIRARATPHTTVKLTTVQKNKIRAMVASGYNTAEIAKQLGRSESSINNYILGKGVNKD